MTSGTPGSAGAYTQITIASGAPTLYYYCSVHSGMGGQVNTNSTAGATVLSGSSNDDLYDQSQTWSNLGTGTHWGTRSWANSFNGVIGDDANEHTLPNAGQTMAWTPSSPITVSDSVVLYGYIFSDSSTYGIKLNGNVWTGTTSDYGASLTIPASDIGGYLSSIQLISDASHNAPYLTGVEIDGKLLVDSGVSLAAVPSINSVVKANPDAGFSIVKYTGDGSQSRVGHGLGKAPELVITKATSASSRWAVQMPTIIGGNYYLELNSTTAKQSWGSQTLNDPTSTTFDTVYANGVNESGVEYVGYCFAPVEGYSSIGSYTGNGSADGPFVHTGFKIRFLLYRRTDVGSNWYIMDTERDPDNPATQRLLAESSNAEYTYSSTDLLDVNSNGFKVRSSNNAINANGGTYIYYAVAETPVNAPLEVDTSGDTQVSLDPLAAIATDILEIDGTTMYLNGATGPWRTGLSIEGSQINAAPPGPNEVTFTSTDNGTTPVSMIDATLSTRTWTLESGTTATGPWTLIDSYTDFDAIDSQDGATPWTTTRPTLQPNTFYRVKVRYDSLNADSVESVYSTFKTGDA